MMYNPFIEKSTERENDRLLIDRIMGGSRLDLEKLVFRHQAWIYNIALKMLLDPADAEDITQEILIKMVTKLASYDHRKGAFRTWLYRIVANHILNVKTSIYERLLGSADAHVEAINNIPDQTISASPENKLLLEELKIKCMTSILLCLDRRHRLVFILGEIFDVKDKMGGEILEVSKANYRKMLSRARKKISNFMNQNCGLLDASNLCNCSRKLKGYMGTDFIRRDHLEFYQARAKKIIDVITKQSEFEKDDDFAAISTFYGDHPFYERPDFEVLFGALFSNDTFREIIHEKFH